MTSDLPDVDEDRSRHDVAKRFACRSWVQWPVVILIALGVRWLDTALVLWIPAALKTSKAVSFHRTPNAFVALTAMAQVEEESASSEHAKFLDSARKYEIRAGASDALLKLHDQSLLNFTNPERNQERGSVFVWMKEDRPAVIGQFFSLNSRDVRVTKHAFHSLLDDRLTAQFDSSVVWAPEPPGLQWKSFDATPTMGANHVARKLQMRQLARRFQVVLTLVNGDRTELRLAPRPLIEYASPKQGVLDGIILSYVIATDPEAILLIEAFQDDRQSGFRYAFARFHFRQLTASEGDREVWRVEYDASMMNNLPGSPETMKKIYNSFIWR
jgi:hypothetical protein